MQKEISTSLIIFSTFVYALLWYISNDSIPISRDGMWYTQYSIYFNDLATNDIRHITSLDFHQIAFLPTYRYLQAFFIELFGANIFGLRAINLLIGIIGIIVVGLFFKKYQFPFYFLAIYILILLFDSHLFYLSHNARPDFFVSILGLITLLLVGFYQLEFSIKYLYLAAFTSSLSLSLYWNGIAVVVAFSFLVLYLFLKKIINFKEMVQVAIFMFILITLLWIVPIYQNYESFLYLFGNDGITKGNTSGISLTNFMILFKNIFLSGNYQFLILIVCVLYFVSTGIVYFNDKKNTNFSKILVIYLTIVILVLAARSISPRHFYMFLPLIYLGIFINLFYMRNKKYKNTKYFILAMTILALLFSIYNFKKVLTFSHQFKTYQKLSSEIQHYIDSNSMVLTVYDFAWAIKNPKFYLENFNFVDIRTQSEFDTVLDAYPIKYIIINEENRKRIDSKKEKYLWYQFLGNYLKKNYTQAGVVYNQYYRQTINRKAKNSLGYANEVWRKIGD